MNMIDAANRVRTFPATEPSDVAPLVRREWNIVGLTCPADAIRLERHLRDVPGVHSVVVNPVTDRAYVSFDGCAVSEHRLREVVERFGYGTK
jgi:copper chaperone CopZ